MDPKLEARFKQILYRCLEEMHVTKAALYLRDDDGLYRVATQYGFKQGLPSRVNYKDEIIDRLLVRRSPYTINGLKEDHLFSEMLFEADTTRILVAPIYSRGKLAGYLDMRDKAEGLDFGSADLTRAMEIADEYLEVFTEEGIYGQRKISAGEVPVTHRVVRGSGPLPIPPVVKRAQEEIKRGVLIKSFTDTSQVDGKVRAAAEVLPAFLGLRSIVVACVSVFSDTGGLHHFVSKGEVPKESIDQFRSRLEIWLERRGEDLPYLRSEVEYPFGARDHLVTPERMKELLGATVRAAEPHTMILSVVFDQKPDEDTRNHLENLHNMLESVVENAGASARLNAFLEKVALKLLEPDLDVYPDLVQHSRRVADLASNLAREIGMADGEIDDVHLAGLVHDVGMRPIGYQRVQRKGRLTEEEMQIIRKHPVVGAAIVASSALGPDVARIVYSHHERADGAGYPDGIPLTRIPVGSRIIHICEAFDAMTAEYSYKPPVANEEALENIRRDGGTQFDADLVGTFCAMIENS